MNTTATTAAVQAFVTKNAETGKYVCTVEGKEIGSSVYNDYFEFHYRKGDKARLNALTISTFVYVEEDGTKKEVQAFKKGEAKPAKVKVEVAKVVAKVEPQVPVCPCCSKTEFTKNGKNKAGVQTYRCKHTKKSFVLAA
jgi:hypothetical protein